MDAECGIRYRSLADLALSVVLALVGLAILNLALAGSSRAVPSLADADPAASCTTVIAADVTVSTTWTLAGSPYCVQTNVQITPGVTLTVDPGVTVLFAPGTGLTTTGGLVAIGTPVQPITFTSDRPMPQPGDWQGIRVPHAGQAHLAYCDVGYGGATGQQGIGIETRDWWTSSQVEIRHCRIHHHLGNGLQFAGYGGWSAAIEDSLIDHNTGYAIYENLEEHDFSTSQFRVPSYRNLTLTGNGTDGLALAGSRYVEADWTLDGPGSFNGKPIYVTGPCTQYGYETVCIHSASGYTLTLAPGTALLFTAGASGGMIAGGNLIAEGSASQPITLTSGLPAPQPGDWRGLQVLGQGTVRLAHCNIGYADTGVSIDNEEATVTLRECRIHHNAVGLYATYWVSPALLGNSFHDNVDYGICKLGEMSDVEALYQWWGHPSGPYHPTANPYGLGDRVSDHVIAKPWLLSETNSPPAIQAVSPASGDVFSGLPIQFQVRVEDPDPDQTLSVRIEVYSGGSLVRTYDQAGDPTGWDQLAYTPQDAAPVTATLTVPGVLANGTYTWQASVFDGLEAASTETRAFQVNLSSWGIATVVPAEPLAVPNTLQTLSIVGTGFLPGAQVWLEQARIGGQVERLDPEVRVAADGKTIAIRFDLTGRSGPWDVIVSQGGVEKHTQLYVLPYLALTSLDYQNTQDLVMNHITPHYLHLANHGTAPGVAVIGIRVPAHTLLLSSLLDPNRVEYLGEVTSDVHLFAVPLDVHESQDVPIYFQLPQSVVNLPGQTIDPNKYDWGDPLRFQFSVLAQPIVEGWQVLCDETDNLEDLANGAIWGSALIEGWAIDRYAELGDEAAAEAYIERLGSRYPFVADALVMRQLQSFQLAAELALDVEDVPSAAAQLGAQGADPGDESPPLTTQNGEFGDWIRHQIGDPWSFAKGFLLQTDENGIPWSAGTTEHERGTFLVAESEGLLEGLTFGLYKPAMGYWNYVHINGDEQGLIDIGHPLGVFLSIPLGAKLPGEVSKGGVSLIRKAADGLRPGGDRYFWDLFKITVEGNKQEPARLGLSVLWKGGDDLASLWKGRDYNLIHWGDNPGFGGSHWGIGWMREPVLINDIVQTGAKGEVLYKAGSHIYANHAYIPYRWGGAPFGEVNIALLRSTINSLYQVPAGAWRSGMLEESLLYPANYVDETACGDGSQRLMSSWDPNDIEGLPRRTHIWPTQPLEFLIRFENVATATLPAGTVVVTLPVHTNLDWDSIRVLGASHPGMLSLQGAAVERTLVWTFSGINLPPNTSPPQGEGWVRLRVQPSPTLTTGQQITAQASIVFDQNEPLWTNIVTYTIDLDPPLSTLSLQGMAGLWPAVQVTATDNAGGAGISTIVLFYSADGEAWAAGPVLTSTQATEVLSGILPFTASGGHYWLCAAATDLAGNAGPLSDERIEVDVEPHYAVFLPLVRYYGHSKAP